MIVEGALRVFVRGRGTVLWGHFTGCFSVPGVLFYVKKGMPF